MKSWVISPETYTSLTATNGCVGTVGNTGASSTWVSLATCQAYCDTLDPWTVVGGLPTVGTLPVAASANCYGF